MRCHVVSFPLVIILSLLVVFGSASGKFLHHHEHGVRSAEKFYPVHISDIINTDEFLSRAVENTRVRNPELYRRALEKAAEPSVSIQYTVGDERNFYVLKFTDRTGAQYTEGWFDEVRFRLMAIGDASYIWVSVDELNNEHVTEVEVTAILDALEVNTPPTSRDPNKGIFELVIEYFGTPPNVGPGGRGTGDGKTKVLLTDIQDGWDPDEGGGFIAGFFFTLDQNMTHQFSNRNDIIYIDTYPGIYNPLTERRNPSRPLSTLAHEFQHLVFHNYRGTSTEETWLNEGLSEFAEAFCGYGLRSPSRYFENTNRAMTEWAPSTSDDVLRDYSRVALWTMYLWEQMGDDVIRHLVQLPLSVGRGIPIVNRAAQEVGSDRRFPELLGDFAIANFVKDTSTDSRYVYDFSFGGRPKPQQYHNDPNVTRSGLQISRYAAYYIEYTFGDSLEITFNATADLRIFAVEVGRDEKKVVPVPLGQTYVQHDYGEVYRTIMFVVINPSATNATVSYSSSGGFRYFVDEYKFDTGVPQPLPGSGATFLRIAGGTENIGSGWAVQFTPEFPENQLVAARIYAAFGQEFTGSDVPFDAPKSFYFHVWGDQNGMPGENLIEPFVVQTTRESFPNDFLEIDLFDYRDQLQNLQGPIYVGLTHNTEHWVAIGMTNALNQNRTFRLYGPNVANPTQRNQWVRMFDLQLSDGTSLRGWNMMMRTVFAVFDPDRRTDPIPERFALRQNFPNPFNQQTRIEYDVSTDSHVNITIYDLLGRRVRTLVDEFKQEGTYWITWDSTDFRGQVVSTGVYYYRMTAGEFSEVRKMIFLR